MKTTKRIIKLLAAWFILHVAFLFYDGLSTTNAKADIGVILGNKVNEDGKESE